MEYPERKLLNLTPLAELLSAFQVTSWFLAYLRREQFHLQARKL